MFPSFLPHNLLYYIFYSCLNKGDDLILIPRNKRSDRNGKIGDNGIGEKLFVGGGVSLGTSVLMMCVGVVRGQVYINYLTGGIGGRLGHGCRL